MITNKIKEQINKIIKENFLTKFKHGFRDSHSPPRILTKNGSTHKSKQTDWKRRQIVKAKVDEISAQFKKVPNKDIDKKE